MALGAPSKSLWPRCRPESNAAGKRCSHVKPWKVWRTKDFMKHMVLAWKSEGMELL